MTNYLLTSYLDRLLSEGGLFIHFYWLFVIIKNMFVRTFGSNENGVTRNRFTFPSEIKVEKYILKISISFKALDFKSPSQLS